MQAATDPAYRAGYAGSERSMKEKLRAGVVGATGMVGQRFITLLDNHPYFNVTALAASARSAGKTYAEAVGSRWKLDIPMPEYAKHMTVIDAADINAMREKCDFVFCAVDMKKDEIRALEEAYAKAEFPVISNNSANRLVPDVPMVIPEINPGHFEVIAAQRKRLGTKRGFIAVKPNCSIQSYVPPLSALLEFEPYEVAVTTYQAISGAGKTFEEWPEILDNVIPYIDGEEEKSEIEPLKIWGKLENGEVKPCSDIRISAQCLRVPVSNGHTAAVFVKFRKRPSEAQILEAWKNYKGMPEELKLPHAPEQFITYMAEPDRPQAKLDRDIYGGMGVTVGRLREDSLFDYKFVGLHHNTLRGAAGGGMLTAELLFKLGYLTGER